MSKEKQIDEMARIIDNNHGFIVSSVETAEALYNAGYRKQKEGVQIKDEESKFEHRYHCSVCNFYLIGEPTKHCEDCGAKMKGGAE